MVLTLRIDQGTTLKNDKLEEEVGIEISIRYVFQRSIPLGKHYELLKWIKNKLFKIFSNWFSFKNLVDFTVDDRTFEHALKDERLCKIIVGVDNSNQLDCLLKIEKNLATFLDPNFNLNHFPKCIVE